MKTITKISEIVQVVNQIKSEGKTIGFVPTMGFLHDGHTSLFDVARRRADVSIASLFVNPTQFGPNEDFAKYPRNIERDTAIAEAHKVDYLFAPADGEMYPQNFFSAVKVSTITEVFDGKLRPGHFDGVALVLVKLFNIVKPNYVFFGQKDYQQTLVVKQIVSDLNIDTQIEVCPTVRLASGLAMSSRNSYLTETELAKATILHKSIEEAKRLITAGERNRQKINAKLEEVLQAVSPTKIDYAAIVMADDLSEPAEFKPSDKAVILLAVYIGKTRLIDNEIVEI